MKTGSEVARSLLTKVRQFVDQELNVEEAEMFSFLIAPGVSLAYTGNTENEVVGFAVPEGQGQWQPGTVASPLSEVLRESGVRVVETSR